MRIAAVTLLVFTFAAARVSANEPARIQVVKTWKDLQNVPPIDLGGGVKVRLGLEADKVPRWSGTLLYCLTEGYTPASGGEGPTLGPVFATCQFGDEEKRKSERTWGSAKKDWPKGSYLFARALAVNRVGTYHIAVTDRQGKAIAKADFEGTKDFFHPLDALVLSSPSRRGLQELTGKGNRPADGRRYRPDRVRRTWQGEPGEPADAVADGQIAEVDHQD
jgi:hypothetical protein